MFNPKQALQRIRKQKTQQQQHHHHHAADDNLDNTSLALDGQPLFPQTTTQQQQRDREVEANGYSQSLFRGKYSDNNSFRLLNSQTVEDRMAKLEALVARLSDKLTESNSTITMLKEQNHVLESHLLKLTHQNSQLKTHKNDSKTNLTHKLSSSLNSLNDNNRVISSLSNDKYQFKRAESKVIQDEVFSPQVDDAMQGIRRQPLENILKRKEQNFRALKSVSKQALAKGERALRELANLQKQYGKNYKKPTLILNLQDTDFQ